MHKAKPILLLGRIVSPDGGARQRYVLVEGGRIRWISRSRPPRALIQGAAEIHTGPQDWIFPGLADLHTHSWYNILPLWHSPRAPFDNRHVWRQDPGYKAAIGGVLKKLKGHVKERKVFSELQAVAGGTTVLDEPRPLDSETGHGPTILCRDTGSPRDFGSDLELKIRSVVDFFKPYKGKPAVARGWGGKPDPIDAYVQDRDKLQAVLVHLAEGRSGFGSRRGVDPYSRAEFEALMKHSAMRDVVAVRASRLAIVHGCGIDVDDPQHIDFLTERGISVIWSPASNMLLYDDTIDAGRLIEHGIQVCLGSDWSPSGSKNVWEEAKFARFFLDAIGSRISDADIFKMVTSNPGNVLGIRRLGRIEEGALADFFILRSPIESDSALEVFFNTTDRDVLATIVGGLPIYGDKTFLGQFDLDLQPLPRREGSAVANKRMHLPAATKVDDFASGITSIEDQLKTLEPPTYRSNLLADSDVHYRRRFQMLRARTERFGWSVRQWRLKRKRKDAKPIGRVPVAPDSVQMRVGWCATGDRDRFLKTLAGTLLPAGAELGRWGGLTALCSAIAPKSKPRGCPDEFGLWFFEEKKAYRRAMETVGGRTTALLEEAVFRYEDGKSWKTTPAKYNGEIVSKACYYLFQDAVDWYQGEVYLTLATRRASAEVEAFHAALTEALDGCAGSEGLDGALAVVDDGYFAVFRHADAGPEVAQGAVPEFWSPALDTVARALLHKTARDVDAKAGLGEPYDGIETGNSDVLRLRFERRQLLPW